MNRRGVRSPAARHSVARSFVRVLVTCASVVAVSLGSAEASDQKKSREKMVELNKQALFFYQAKNWEDAKESLNEALDIAEAAGLQNNNMTARTYLHLGAVEWVGFHDRDAAIQNFSMSKQIRPDIQLTPLIETADLKAVFDSAPNKVETQLPVEPATPQPATRGPARSSQAAPGEVEREPEPTHSSQVAVGSGDGEPALPSSMSAPLMCTLPTVALPDRALTIRCALRPGLEASVVQIHYRPRGFEQFQAQSMGRTPAGWYIVTLPREVMQEGSLHVYFDARDDSDKQVARIGQFSSPSVIAVRERSSIGGGGTEEDPLRRAREQARSEKYEAGLHRRRAGSFWLGMGAGLGWGYVPAGSLEWENRVRISAVTTTTGSFHLAPEIGTMLSDNFGLALQGRIEFIKQEQASYMDPATGAQTLLTGGPSGAPSTLAPALFARAIGYLDLSDNGNLRFSYSGDLGGGFIRFPVKPSASVSYNSNTDMTDVNWDKSIEKTDTRPVGVVLFGASVGITWNLSRHFAIAWNGRALSGLPSWGAVFESTLSGQLAFGGKSGQESMPDEDEDE